VPIDCAGQQVRYRICLKAFAMRYLFRCTAICVLFTSIQVQAAELRSLADCSEKVFREINRTGVWSGKPPEGCLADVYVEKRPNGVFVTTWRHGTSDSGWVRVALSSALGFYEVADRKSLEQGIRDIAGRTARIERCLNSIIQVNDPLECRDSAAKTYSAGEETGFEFKRRVWLDDNGRHVVAEYAYGDTNTTASPPSDLFGGSVLPPGTSLNIHIFDAD